ncbi:MAG TPA: Fe-S oxidoreductase, partial [Flavobacteriales bacterium]|nr:Fe-S oxidoreductase [Flavobacteriales bacterium]
MSIENIAFIALFVTAVTLFTLKIREIIANIRMGQAIDRSGNASERWKTMLLVAFG